jgi:hypothetical protein
MKALVFIAVLLPSLVGATHLRCGHISLSNISGLTYEVKIIVYTNTASPVRFSDGTLNFGDGTTTTTPTIESTPFLPSVGLVSFSVNHTFPATGNYTITYFERNLNAGIVNISNSVNRPMYLEATAFLDAAVPYFSPEFLAPPIFKQVAGKLFSLSHGAVDRNDNQLRYLLANPLGSQDFGFSLPENFGVNFYNGLITWDAEFRDGFSLGEYLFAVKIIQIDKNGKNVGDLTRTFQIVLEDSNTGGIAIGNSINDVNNKVFIPQGKSKSIKVWAQDGSNGLSWQVFFDKNLSPNLSFSQYDSSANSKFYKVGVVNLSATAGILRDNPYMVTLRAESSVSGFKTYRDLNFLFFTKDVDLPSVVTGLERASTNEVDVYPNPFHSIIYLKAEEADQILFYQIFDSMGRLVVEDQFQFEDSIDTSHLAAGLYIMKLGQNRRTSFLKLIKR